MNTTPKKPKAPTFDMKPVQSSSIKAHGYDAASKTLAVQFGNGTTYHYAGVPPEAAEALGKADSAGKHFASAIRDKFKGTKQ